MSDIDLAYQPATKIAHLIRTKVISPVEVVRNAIERIEEINPKLNAFCFVYAEEAMQKAQLAEQAIMARDRVGPLHGVPVAFKDLTPTKGKRTTRGSYVFEHWVPDTDAIVVERLLAAGAIMVGKTTTGEFACSGRAGSLLWGVTRNPWNSDHTPGWSSCGSAVAVATGCVSIAEGSDMGGSVRNPAAYCNLVGLKPSFGRIPFGIYPSILDQTCHFGPLARTCDDAALFLSVAQGPDDRDIQAFMPPADITLPLSSDVRGLRLAFSPDLGYAYVHPEVAANIERAVQALADAGATVDKVALGLTKEVSRVDRTFTDSWAPFFMGDQLSELDKWRDKLDPSYVRSVENGLKISAMELRRGEIIATNLWNALWPVFAKYDALLCPSTLTPAMRIDFAPTDFDYEDDDGRYHARSLAGPFNLVSRCPSVQAPTGFSSDGLPTGIQIVGRRYDDPLVLKVAKALEKSLVWTKYRPPI